MTRGFWKGLLHGGLLSAGALAALSLIAPLSPPDEVAVDRPSSSADEAAPAAPQPVENAQKPEPAAEAAGEPGAVTTETPPATAEAPAIPEAEATREEAVISAVDLPVGSEFGRGGDLPPLMPQPLEVPQGAQAQSEAPGVMAPAEEAAPVTESVNDARPDTGEGAPTDLVAQADEAAPDVDLPSALQMPTALSSPTPLGTAERDSAPDMSALTEVREIAAVDAVEPQSEAPEPPMAEAMPSAQPMTAVPERAGSEQPASQDPAAPQPEATVVTLPQPDISLPWAAPDVTETVAAEAAETQAAEEEILTEVVVQRPATNAPDLSLPPDITSLWATERN